MLHCVMHMLHCVIHCVR